nr:MoxR family ATPase [bacterium]
MPQADLMLKLIKENISRAIVGKDTAIEQLLVALICRGHVLIEDVPGVGKTSLIAALARSLDCSFSRIQFTPDVMPSDITGFTAANIKTGEFHFQPGAVMSQIVLADEINRTSPKTQSALLEVMSEQQVTVDGVTYPMPKPFMVMATQNPIEFVGTYPLPEAQLDRFFLRLSLGYPSVMEEVQILERYQSGDPLKELEPVATAEQVLELQQQVDHVKTSVAIHEYISRLVAVTREAPDLTLGVSPRGSIALLKAARGYALLRGRDYVLPDDVQSMVEPVLSHRLILKPEARLREKSIKSVLKATLQAVKVPGV